MWQAEIIAIGDELTSGQRLDTNSQWLAERLGELGIRTLFHTTVGDDLAGNVAVFRTACQRAEIVVATGGLGPTADDLTREALAAVTDQPLECDAASLAYIEGLFARRGRAMPERNRVQAFLPRGCRVIPNAYGTAPGIEATITRAAGGTARVFALPGVPAEMKPMWHESVAPALAAMGTGERLVHKRLKCFGVGESDLEALLPDLIRRGREPLVGITVHRATITLRITARAASAAQAQAHMEPTLATIRSCLGPLVFGEDDDELEHAVVRVLALRGQTLATFETGTGGLLADWLSEADTAGCVFRGGVIERHPSALPPDRFAQRAREVLAQTGADFLVATGPFPAPPASGEPQNPGDFLYGVAGANLWRLEKSRFAGNPDVLRDRSAKQSLNLLRLWLGEHEKP